MAPLTRSSDAQPPGVTFAADDLGSFCTRRDDHGDPAHRADATIEPMAERAAVERDLEEIAAQLAWVRDYL